MYLYTKNLFSGYQDTTILWNININVKKGEIVTVLGPNGAGKTTLLYTLAGILYVLSLPIGLFFLYLLTRPHVREYLGVS